MLPKNPASYLSEDQEKTFRAQSWSYFSLHSAQRMQSFQFYITLETALIGGAIVIAKSDGNHQHWMTLLSAMVSLLSFIFWKLDGRTRKLIKNAESALRFLDGQHNLPNINAQPHPVFLFKIDGVDNSSVKSIWNINLSYSKCFNIIFGVFGFGGFVCVLQSVLTG
ncbi:hypothetical protein KDX15_01905 [Burkholderia cenocepacia]|uniref:RipA family octameric membrane protein n=1 Tax=Burkholderia cenocepacia TaxID=95486 RepID=UPI001B9E7067|nr:hypothetical protein [Burkholderia cenocepacia]MBR8272572.1 hypothetical protein [Burkholderia cenocepacia]